MCYKYSCFVPTLEGFEMENSETTIGALENLAVYCQGDHCYIRINDRSHAMVKWSKYQRIWRIAGGEESYDPNQLVQVV